MGTHPMGRDLHETTASRDDTQHGAFGVCKRASGVPNLDGATLGWAGSHCLGFACRNLVAGHEGFVVGRALSLLRLLAGCALCACPAFFGPGRLCIET